MAAAAAVLPETPSLHANLASRTLGHEQKALLDLIDDLRSSSLSHIRLPQIVVVGDQNAGKSSVLTAITGVHFPRDANACTRFPTEVRLRRAKDAGTTVRIVPGRTRTTEQRRALEAFRRSVGPTDVVGLASLLDEATALIASLGLSGKFAARDRLRVDCWGPDKGHLSFVDLPGFVKVSNNEQTDEDRAAIEEIADEYMRSSRAIILAIVGGNVDYVQQTVLAKVKQFDPHGLRTLGVLTKPDLVAGINQEDKFLDLVNGGEHDFRLGWHVLLNGGKDVVWSPEERKVREREFFSQGKWRKVPEENWGADRLWERVSVQLSQQIARYIPKILREIEKELKKCEVDLEALGAGCDTTEEMKSELSKFFSASKFLIDGAVEGRYRNHRKGPKFFPLTPAAKGTPIQHLRARVVKENKRFVEKMETQGRKVSITQGEPGVLAHVSSLVTRQVSREAYIRDDVSRTLDQNIGLEQEGDHDPTLIYKLFQAYSHEWDKLAEAHKADVEALCRTFLEELIRCVWPERMRAPLWSHLLNKDIEQANQAAQKEVGRLLEDRELYVRAYDPAYVKRVEDWKKEQTEKGRVPSEEEVYLEKMLIYYDLTVKTFISNILTQVIERHLLQTLGNLFEIENFGRMSEETVRAIAAEDVASIQKRLELKEKKKDIEDQRRRCKQVILREDIQRISSTDTDSSSDGSGGDSDGSPATTTHHHPAIPRTSRQTPAAAQAPPSPNRKPLAQPNNPSSPTATNPAPATPATPLRPSRPSHDQVNGTATLTPNQTSTHATTNGTASSTHTPKPSTSTSNPVHTRQGSIAVHSTMNGDYNSTHMPGTWDADYNPPPTSSTQDHTNNYATSNMPAHLAGPWDFSPGPSPSSGGRSNGAGGEGVNGYRVPDGYGNDGGALGWPYDGSGKQERGDRDRRDKRDRDGKGVFGRFKGRD